MADCFSTIIGLSDRECDCFVDGAPETDTDVSDSGLFLTDILAEEDIEAIVACDETIWSLMSKARSTGIAEFQAAMNANLMRKNAIKHKTFKGYVGETKSDSYLTTDKAYFGIRITTNAIRSGYLKISRILAMFEATGTVECTIYDMSGNAIAEAFDITTASGGAKTITDVQINLPLLADFEGRQDYFLVFAYNGANRPRLNKVACGTCTGFIPYRQTGTPRFANRSDKFAWHNYLVVGSWEGDSVADFFDYEFTDVGEYMNGICLEVEVGCDLNRGLCQMLTDGFDANPYAMSVATAIQRFSAAWLYDRMILSSQPNRTNLINKDEKRAQAGVWRAEFAEIVQYLSSNMPEFSNDCIECKSRTRVGAILG